MAQATDTPAPAQPNAAAILAIAADHNGPDNRLSEAIIALRGEGANEVERR